MFRKTGIIYGVLEDRREFEDGLERFYSVYFINLSRLLV